MAAVAAGLAPLLLPPLPRQLKPPRPQPEPFRLGRSFLASIPAAAVPRVIDGPAAAHHRRVEFAGFGAAHGDDPLVTVPVPLAALHLAPAGQLGEHRRGIPAALVITAVLAVASLLAFGCVDAP